MFGLFKPQSAQEIYENVSAECRRRFEVSRRKALLEVRQKHPDALCLMTSNCETFLAYSKASQKVMYGYFNDFPKLDYVTAEASDLDFENAVEKYNITMTRLKDYINNPYLKKSARYREFWSVSDDHFDKGYHIIDYDSRRAGGYKLEIGGALICETSLDDPAGPELLRERLDEFWFDSNELSSMRAFTIQFEIHLYGFGSIFLAPFKSLFLGGVSLRGSNKKEFSRTVIQPIIDFVSAVPFWQNGSDSWFNFMERIQINDDEDM